MKHEILCNGYNRFHINIGQLERYNELFFEHIVTNFFYKYYL
jgi:hypothetical protein